MRGIAVVGTHRGVGATRISWALADALIDKGRRLRLIKGVELGCSVRQEGGAVEVDGMPGELSGEARKAYQKLNELVGPPPITVSTKTKAENLAAKDASFLLEKLGPRIPQHTIDEMNTYRFTSNVSPAVAAKLAEITIEQKVFEKMAVSKDEEHLLVDMGVGLFEPLSDSLLVIDLLKALDLGVLIVAPSNHQSVSDILMMVDALKRRELSFLGAVLNRQVKAIDVEEAANPLAIEMTIGECVRGVLPYVEAGEDKRWLDRFKKHVDIHAINMQLNPFEN